jgi:hypothetical protein
MRVFVFVALVALVAAATTTKTTKNTKTTTKTPTKTPTTITTTRKTATKPSTLTKRTTKTTTRTITTTTTTLAPTINPAWFVGPYAFAEDWPEHQMCRFQLIKSPKLNFTAAQSFCQEFDSSVHLAIVPDKATNDFLLALDPTTDVARWIGASRNVDSEDFLWLDGSNITYTNWGFGEPNSPAASTGNLAENCVAQGFSTTAKGKLQDKWNDANCNKNFRFYCQFCPTAAPSEID